MVRISGGTYLELCLRGGWRNCKARCVLNIQCIGVLEILGYIK